MKLSHAEARRGVLLLVILALLAMFGLVAVTFVVLTRQQMRSAQVGRRTEQQSYAPWHDTDRAAMQVLRGSNNSASRIGVHSLLEDLYGNEAYVGNFYDDTTDGGFLDTTNIAGGQLIEFACGRLDPDPNNVGSFIFNPNGAVHRLVGCVLTMLSGSAKGQSTRIVGVSPQTGYPQILAFQRGVPASGDRYVVNGAPFSGTGFGYHPMRTLLAATETGEDFNGNGQLDPGEDLNGNGQLDVLNEDVDGDGRLDTAEQDADNNNILTPGTEDRDRDGHLDIDEDINGISGLQATPGYALLPNLTAVQANSLIGYGDPAGAGGANEDYDAPDYQNMLLAMRLPSGDVPIPSLHRPALINYWFNELRSNAAQYVVDPNGVWQGMSPQQQWNAILQPYGPNGIAGDGDENWPFDLVLADSIVNLKRKIILRPLPEDHPYFDGSNPYGRPDYGAWTLGEDQNGNGMLDAGEDSNGNGVLDGEEDTNGDGILDPAEDVNGNGRLDGPLSLACLDRVGPWDVDNDGDGLPDSIWVDLGFPVRSTADGRQYKPLFAILCVDMDGRLNLNAHGCLQQTENSYYPALISVPTAVAGLKFAGDAIQTSLWRGQGCGPADIDLRPLFPGASPQPQYQNLLAGTGQYAGRYADAIGLAPPGVFDQGPGEFGQDDALSQNRCYQYPGAFGSPMDSIPDGAIGLDMRGHPLYPNMGVSEQVDDPYELDLSPTAARGLTGAKQIDAPFSPTELEAVLRASDIDGGRLPKRLSALAANLLNHRHEITTESWDLPCPNVALPIELRQELIESEKSGGDITSYLPGLRPHHVSDLLLAKLIAVHGASSGQLLFNANVSKLLPREMLAGLKMDVNRPFGNGRDDTPAGTLGHGVVDEPEEVLLREQISQFDATGAPVTAEFDHVNGVDVSGDGLPDPNLSFNDPVSITARNVDRVLARQLYARHLYVLMMMVMDMDALPPGWLPAAWDPSTLTADEKEAAWAPHIAQWAINVVDFRDRDSIMTPFEYDIHPFKNDDGDAKRTTWDVDGSLSTDHANLVDSQGQPCRGLVWGCERPELLITETLAFHDRRTENLSADGGEYNSDAQQNKDTHNNYDQRLRPQGSLFVELYNPWANLEATPGEFLYDKTGDGMPDYPGVDLAKMAGTSPVWRMIIVQPDPAKPDPDDPDPTNRPTIERSVYFANPTGNAQITGDGRQYYPDPTAPPPLAPIKPGRYAVVGPGEGPGPNTTYLGFKDTIANPDDTYSDSTTRRIVLTPTADPDTPQVEIYSDGTNDDLSSLAILPAVAVVINPPGCVVGNETRPMRLSVSEPVNCYPVYDAANANATEYNPIRDDPLDVQGEAPYTNGTTSGYRVIYLQRLANPLAEYDPETNPYRTIDLMQIDLTAFNGVTSYNAGDQKRDPWVNAGQYDFYTRERGDVEEHNAPATPDLAGKLWPQEPVDPSNPPRKSSTVAPPALQNHYFTEDFAHTLGHLNEAYQPLYAPAVAGDYGPGDIYKGGPARPFPWLTWNNRPFVSQLELLLVPTPRSSRLLSGFSVDAGNTSPYEVGGGQPFTHLLNFLLSEEKANVKAPQLHRVFEFLHVPSRFVGTQTQWNPTTVANANNHNFRPPFHWISNYREPGRINLNTITSRNVFMGLMNGFKDPDINLWESNAPPLFLQSRRSPTGLPRMHTIASGFPTRTESPFRSFGGEYLVPELASNNPLSVSTLRLRPDPEVNATLLRQNPNPSSSTAMFEYARPQQATIPASDMARNPRRNPYFRYQGLMRLGNLVTTRSNVYAVWITVGYFEVEPNPTGVDPAHPDGYRLGPELGIETGEVERHRAFYMFDRSRPVGFMRGHDLNAENAILLKRFIE